jgi:hypothetical protein
MSGRRSDRVDQEAGEHQMVKRWSSIPRVNVELADEVVDAFRQALKSREHRERQLADFRCCRGLGLCGICNEYERLVAIVDTALGVRPSKLSPVDVIYGPAPPTWTADEQADWDRARDQHLELAEAAKIEPRRKALLTDACRGHCNVRWVERHCFAPDGPFVGQPFRLLEFQRDIIRKIYADPSYWQAVDAAMKNRRKLQPKLQPKPL